jgi:hypothetical protein
MVERTIDLPGFQNLEGLALKTWKVSAGKAGLCWEIVEWINFFSKFVFVFKNTNFDQIINTDFCE